MDELVSVSAVQSVQSVQCSQSVQSVCVQSFLAFKGASFDARYNDLTVNYLLKSGPEQRAASTNNSQTKIGVSACMTFSCCKPINGCGVIEVVSCAQRGYHCWCSLRE